MGNQDHRSSEAGAIVDASVPPRNFDLERTVQELQEKYQELALQSQNQLDQVASQQTTPLQMFRPTQDMYMRDRGAVNAEARGLGKTSSATVEKLEQALDEEVQRRCMLISEVHQKMGKDIAGVMRQMEIRLLEVDEKIGSLWKHGPAMNGLRGGSMDGRGGRGRLDMTS